MKNGVCPKCDGRDVREVPGERTGISISNRRVLSAGSFAKLYFCSRCGHIEFYVENEAGLPGLAAVWPKVPVSK